MHKNYATMVRIQKTTPIGKSWFFQHLGWDEGKQGIVLWGPSDPLIFGHPENINLLKDRKYLVPNQFLIWEQQEYQSERFVKPNEVMEHLWHSLAIHR